MSMTEQIEQQGIQIPREQLQREVGQRLYEARRARRLSQEEVASMLKFSVTQVAGLEEGDWSRLPDDIYALGFLRQYANLLHLDIDMQVQQLKSEITLQRPWTIPDPPVAPNRRWAWASLLLLLALLLYFNLDGPLEKSSQIVDPRPHSMESGGAPAQEAKSSAPPIANANASAHAEHSASEQPSPARIEEAPPPSPQSVEMPPSEDHASIAKALHELQLRAVGDDVWLQIHRQTEDGNKAEKLRETLLHNGESLRLQTKDKGVILTIGNAIALEIQVDGATRYAPGELGRDGRVLRDFLLSLESEKHASGDGGGQ